MAVLIRRGARRRIAMLVTLVVLGAGLGLATMSSSGAQQDSTGQPFLFVRQGELRFETSGSSGQFVWQRLSGSNVSQPLSVGTNGNTNCLVLEPATIPLVDLAPNRGTNTGVGFVGGSLGVFSGGSRGTPCGRVAGSEVLSLKLTGQLQGITAYTARLDLELKGTALVEAAFYRTGQTAPVATRFAYTGTATPDASLYPNAFRCGDASDSGPDSGPGDNCVWQALTSTDNLSFDEVRIRAVTGEVSLEGGGDWADPSANRTVFLLGGTEISEGDLACDEFAVEAQDGTDVTAVRGDNLSSSGCGDTALLPYSLRVARSGADVVFRKDLLEDTDSAFNLRIAWAAPQTIASLSSPSTIDWEVGVSSSIDYCPVGVKQTRTVTPDKGSTSETVEYWSITAAQLAGRDMVPDTILPGIQFACVWRQSQEAVGSTSTTPAATVRLVQEIYVTGDAIMRR